MDVTCENVYIGARISDKEGNQLTVVKVNQKSFYATRYTYDEYLEKWDCKSKGVTFKEFCKVWEVGSYKYSSDFQITEEEVSRKEKCVANAANAYKVDYKVKRALSTQINAFRKAKKKLRFLQVDVGKDTVRIIEENGDNFFLNINNDYVLYSHNTGEYVKVSSVFDYNEKEIPWGRLSQVA